MQTQILNYRIVVASDQETGTGKAGYTAYCPTLGIADDGNTIEEAITNVREAIEVYVNSLVEDNLSVPIDSTENDLVTTTQISVSGKFSIA